MTPNEVQSNRVLAHRPAQAENRVEAEKVVAGLQAGLSAKQVAAAKLAGETLEVTAVYGRYPGSEINC